MTLVPQCYACSHRDIVQRIQDGAYCAHIAKSHTQLALAVLHYLHIQLPLAKIVA